MSEVIVLILTCLLPFCKCLFIQMIIGYQVCRHVKDLCNLLCEVCRDVVVWFVAIMSNMKMSCLSSGILSQESFLSYLCFFQISCIPENINTFDLTKMKRRHCSDNEKRDQYSKINSNTLSDRNCGCLIPCTQIRYDFRVGKELNQFKINSHLI